MDTLKLEGQDVVALAEKAAATPVVAPAPKTVKQVVDRVALGEQRRKQGRCPECGKPVMRPKEGGLGSTCADHRGKLRQYAVQAEKPPEGWLRMSRVCDAAEAVGLTRNSVVMASGGDACTKALLDPLFQIVYVGRAKYMHPDVLTTGFKLIKEHKAQAKADVEAGKPAPVAAQKPNSTAAALKAAAVTKKAVVKK